jgi:hypothetical protein
MIWGWGEMVAPFWGFGLKGAMEISQKLKMVAPFRGFALKGAMRSN